jgi:ADP-ribosyl-[dinitrogen reductase] hydrolase
MGLLLDLAIGDAYGRPFEFATREYITAFNDGKYHLRDKEAITDPIIGKYTDDTQMTLGVAEHMLSGNPTTQVGFVREFLKVYKRDPHQGYSRRLTNALTKSEKPFDFLSTIDARSTGNGCVMRCLPLGLLPDAKSVIQASIVQASTTHATHEGILATEAIALSAHYFYHIADGKFDDDDWYDWMRARLGEGFALDLMTCYHLDREDRDGKKEPNEEVPCDAMITAAACLHIIRNEFSRPTQSMLRMLKKSISLGGDVDSIAAVTMGLASLLKVKNDLPKELYDNLEDGPYGKGYIKLVEDRLVAKFPIVRPVVPGSSKDLEDLMQSV